MSEVGAQIESRAPQGVALLIIDMISRLDFPGAEHLHAKVDRVAEAVTALRETAESLDAPVIYVNDNHGQWHSERSRLVEQCSEPESPGRRMVEKIAPRMDDFFVIKPQFSGFYATTLPVLLPKLGVSRLVLTGIAADICVLFTAADAHMRDYDLWVPADTTCGEDDQRTAWALEIMKETMGAEIRPTAELAFGDWCGGRTA